MNYIIEFSVAEINCHDFKVRRVFFLFGFMLPISNTKEKHQSWAFVLQPPENPAPPKVYNFDLSDVDASDAGEFEATSHSSQAVESAHKKPNRVRLYASLFFKGEVSLGCPTSYFCC